MDCEEGKQKEDNQLIVLFFSPETSTSEDLVSLSVSFYFGFLVKYILFYILFWEKEIAQCEKRK